MTPLRTLRNFFHKTLVLVSVSVSKSSSSSRMIPVIPILPSLDQTLSLDETSSSSSFRFHQSAPVNVLGKSSAMMKVARRRRVLKILEILQKASGALRSSAQEAQKMGKSETKVNGGRIHSISHDTQKSGPFEVHHHNKFAQHFKLGFFIVLMNRGFARLRKDLFSHLVNQVWTHDFWEFMIPGGGGRPTWDLLRLIERDFGSFGKFLAELKTGAATQFVPQFDEHLA